MIKENTQEGSWMWKKILKYRETSKKLYRVELNNGRRASFWFETWSSLGSIWDLLNGREQFDLGIPLNSTMEACRRHRRRNHRVVLLNRIEDEIEKYKETWGLEEDISL